MPRFIWSFFKVKKTKELNIAKILNLVSKPQTATLHVEVINYKVGT